MKIRFERKETKKVWPDRPFVAINKSGSVYLVGNEGSMISLYSSGATVRDVNWNDVPNRDEQFSLYTGTITIQNY
jgi:hypothetical protein